MSHTALTFEEHLAGIAAATDRLAAWATEAGLDTGVPTCPGWTVRDLLAHEGMVHRWATRVVRGGDWRDTDDAAVEAEGRATEDPVGWVRAGAAGLLDALRAAPEDLEAFTFLRQAPPPRLFWARRQDHESTIHALDALAAREGRRPTAADAWFDAEHALDGVDELLVGFWQRRTKGPRAPQGKPYAALVVADSGERWLLDVSAERVETHHLAADEPGPDTATSVLSGTAVDLYLALWNRGGHVDDPALLVRRWQEGGAITW
jgi:uncharacterized protein (TIGR03083 family)